MSPLPFRGSNAAASLKALVFDREIAGRRYPFRGSNAAASLKAVRRV